MSAHSLSPRNGSEIGRQLGGRYRLVAPIGIGSSSRVFLAVDTQLRRRVAVKVLHATLAADDTFLKRFRAEARAAAALSHPNILAVYDWGEDETDEGVAPYLVTEYLGGGSLRRILDRGRPLSPGQALIVGLDAARALGHAHRRGLVHRDIKPANLLFDTGGRLRLADFGLARALAEASWTEPMDTMAGTARYASPEQASGQRLDGRSDVYSLALVLVECVTGEVPFSSDTRTGTLERRKASDLVVPDALGGLRPTLERAGRLDPTERPDAAELEISLWAAAETMDRPEPLPLVATLDEAEVTSELSLVEGLDGIAALRPLGDGSGEPDTGVRADGVDRDVDVVPLGGGTPSSDRASADDRVRIGVADADRGVVGDGVVGGGAEEAVSDLQGSDADAEVAFGRSPIVVAEEHHLLSASRPVSFGRIEPLDPDAGPEIVVAAPTVVQDSEPPPRRRRPSARLLVALVVLSVLAGAAAWWFLVRVPSHEVPALVGSDVAEARAAAREHRWHLDDDRVVRADGTRAGQVVRQSPTAGSALAEGATLRVTVSLGPTLVALPKVDGMSRADATTAIEDAGLRVGPVQESNDEQVPAGSVVSVGVAPGQESPAADGTVPKGSLLALVVSTGPAPRVVPDGLTGASSADAKAKLAAVQLGAEIREDYSDTVPAATVISAGTAAGATVPRGTAVTLVVSKGPAPVPVPNVVGQSGTAASAALQAGGFAVSGIEGSPSNVVLATDPPAGEPHAKGTAVRIFTRR